MRAVERSDYTPSNTFFTIKDVEYLLREETYNYDIIEISAPPGIGKTLEMMRAIARARDSFAAFFPTHANAAVAFKYLMLSMSELRSNVIEYGGAEHYCVMRDYELVRTIVELARSAGYDIVDYDPRNPLTLHLVEALEKDDKALWRETVEKIVSTGGWEALCRVCPLRKLYKLALRRRAANTVLRGRFAATWNPRTMRETGDPRVLYTNPRRMLPRNILRLALTLRGGEVPPSVAASTLCPRMLLTDAVQYSRRGERLVVPLSRRSVVIAPHGAFDYVISRFERARGGPPYRVYIDEYDVFLRPERFLLVEAGVLRRLADGIRDAASVIEKLARDDEFGDISDVALFTAEVIAEGFERIAELVRDALRTGEYAGTFFFVDEVARMRMKLAGTVFAGWMPRVVRASDVLGEPAVARLLVLERYVVEEFDRTVGEITVERAVQIISRAVRSAPNTALLIDDVTGLVEDVENISVEEALARVRRGLRVVLTAPSSVVYYAVDDSNRVVAESIDVPLIKMLAHRAVATSATPLNWEMYVRGTAPPGGESMAEQVASGARHSLVIVERDGGVTRFSVRTWSASASELALRASMGERVNVREHVAVRSGRILRAELSSAEIADYIENMLILLFPAKPLGRLSYEAPREHTKSINKYIAVIDEELGRSSANVLVAAQNKQYAEMIATHYGLEPVEVNGKLAYYAGRRLLATWFRSVMGRGVEFSEEIGSLVVFGSPLPHPRTVTTGNVDTENTSSAVIRVPGASFVLAHTPRDTMNAISELAQVVGRAVRSARRRGAVARIVLPIFIVRKLVKYAPSWLRMALEKRVASDDEV